MNVKNEPWTKTELQIYILLECANADFVETPVELRFISTHVDEKSFDKIYNEFSMDSEEERIRKIKSALAHHEFTKPEIAELKEEIHEVFLANRHISMAEHQLEALLDELLE